MATVIEEKWHSKNLTELEKILKTDFQRGLSNKSVLNRLKEYGYNRLIKTEVTSPFKIFISQFSNILILILIIALTISILMNEIYDATAIFVIILINAILGYKLEYRAEKAIEELSKYARVTINVLRDSLLKTIYIDEIVIGDVILLSAGDIVPADCRLIESNNLVVDEAPLTGESTSVDKQGCILKDTTPLFERTNMAYSGTSIKKGKAKAIVVSTGMNTEIGKIASMLKAVKKEKSPLEAKIAKFSINLAIIASAFVILIFTAGLFQGQELEKMIIFTLSLAVAAVPEGLPLIITITLAIGAERMLREKALIKRLMSVETLGSVNTICSDKTGTITENKMQAKSIYTPDLIEYITLDKMSNYDIEKIPALRLILINSLLCNNIDENQKYPSEPTELALYNMSKQFGLDYNDPLKHIIEIPFDANRKMMSKIYFWNVIKNQFKIKNLFYKGINNKTYISLIKGSFENIINNCSFVFVDNLLKPISNYKEKITEIHNKMASQGQRIIAFSFNFLDLIDDKVSKIESNMIFSGLVGLTDPVREGVVESIKTAYSAGLRVILITGDNPVTATAVGKTIGIKNCNNYMTGADLDNLNQEELEENIQTNNIFARIVPEQKLRIVEMLQSQNNIVAMTGDGVNDAPALKKADIGISMGIKGTNVSKEVSDIILLDDNFNTIINTIKEGRIIFDNIKKFLAFLLGCNLGELFVIILATFLVMPLPLTPLQILWINLLTDGLPAMALSIEKAESDIMNRPPLHKNIPLLSKQVIFDIVFIAIITSIISLITGFYFHQHNADSWQTMLFTALTFTQLGIVLSIRTNSFTIFKGFFDNTKLINAVIISFIAQLIIIYTHSLQKYFHTTALNIYEFFICISCLFLAYILVEIKKFFYKCF